MASGSRVGLRHLCGRDGRFSLVDCLGDDTPDTLRVFGEASQKDVTERGVHQCRDVGIGFGLGLGLGFRLRRSFGFRLGLSIGLRLGFGLGFRLRRFSFRLGRGFDWIENPICEQFDTVVHEEPRQSIAPTRMPPSPSRAES